MSKKELGSSSSSIIDPREDCSSYVRTTSNDTEHYDYGVDESFRCLEAGRAAPSRSKLDFWVSNIVPGQRGQAPFVYAISIVHDSSQPTVWRILQPEKCMTVGLNRSWL